MTIYRPTPDLRSLERRSHAPSLASGAVLILWSILVVNALFTQTQVIFLGDARIPLFAIKIAFVLLVSILAFSLGVRVPISSGTIFLWLLYVVGVVGAFIISLGTSSLDFATSLNLLLVTHLYIFFFPCYFIGLPDIIRSKVAKWLMGGAIPIFLLGCLQFVSNDPIISTDSASGNLFIQSWDFYGQVRAFSLFTSGLDFSLFIALVVAVALASWGSSGMVGRCFISAILALGIASTAMTLTRLAYFFVPQAILFSLLFSYRKIYSRGAWIFLPWLNLLVVYIVTDLAPLLDIYGFGIEIGKSDSLDLRFESWGNIWNLWLVGGFNSVLFGTGVAAGAANPDFIVDNLLLSLLLQSGIVGATLTLIFVHNFWMRLRDFLSENPEDAFTIGLCAFWSTWLATGYLNSVLSTYMLYAIPLLFSRSDALVPNEKAIKH